MYNITRVQITSKGVHLGKFQPQYIHVHVATVALTLYASYYNIIPHTLRYTSGFISGGGRGGEGVVFDPS